MISNRAFYSVLALCFITYLLGMVMIPLMDIDAAQYASISLEMLERKSYLQLFDLGNDYLDKPPMLFWLSSFSMRVFGPYDWAYRLPSFCFAILAVYATFRFTLLFYRREIAQLSALVLASSQALFLITHDVRCDTMLMGWVMFSVWQLAAWYGNNSWKHFVLAFAGIAGGMMTKGPIALMVPAFAFVPHFILQRNWKQLFRWQYILGLLIIAILLVPMSIGLYEQYDLHPGKLINGVPIQSGLRFYYWTQSFGRYTGENVFHEMSYFTFLLENMLWSFLPWILCFLLALVFDVIDLVKKRCRIGSDEEWISTAGFIVTYCVLARSQAQLPHYIFVVFPFAAIVTARFLYSLLYTNQRSFWRRALLIFHAFIFSLLWVAVIVLMAWPFEQIPKFVPGIAGLCMIIFFWMMRSRKKWFPMHLELAFYTVIGVNIFLSAAFYPNLLKYQLGNDAAGFIKEQQLPKNRIAMFGMPEDRSLAFYSRGIYPMKKTLGELSGSEIIITGKDSLASVKKAFPAASVLHEGNDFGVSMLSLPFLNPDSREKELPKYEIIDLSGKP